MSKISNVITMLNLLSNGKKYSINELSEILEVTPRMIRMYKDELEKAGIYIDSIKGPYGGYVLNNSVRLPERKFKKSDYKLLDKYINLDNEDKNSLIILKDKIRGIYINSKEEKAELNGVMQERYNIFARAIKEHRKVRLLYFSYDKGNNSRIIQPVELFLFKGNWYCSAFCELRNDIRHFELKRVVEIELLKEKY